MTWQLNGGAIEGAGIVTARKTVGEMAHLFADESSALDLADALVYETYAVEGDGLLFGTTVLYPGRVGAEYFMTRGHFHTSADRGETVLTLSGSGELRLMSRSGDRRIEPMEAGSLHLIDGAWAHRVVNTGSVPLIFYVTWLSDCGHEYDAITRNAF